MPAIEISKGPNRVCVSPSHLRTETDPVFETLCFLVFRIPDGGQSLIIHELKTDVEVGTNMTRCVCVCVCVYEPVP
jgi:hypothetical protein